MSRRPDLVPPVDAPEWVDAFRGLEGRMTELISITRGLMLNGVLRASLEELDANGFATFETSTPFAGLSVTNLGAGSLVVATASAAAAAPTTGIGVFRVPSGRMVTQPAAGTVLTVYGTPGATFNLLLSAHPLAPNFG